MKAGTGRRMWKVAPRLRREGFTRPRQAVRLFPYKTKGRDLSNPGPGRKKLEEGHESGKWAMIAETGRRM